MVTAYTRSKPFDCMPKSEEYDPSLVLHLYRFRSLSRNYGLSEIGIFLRPETAASQMTARMAAIKPTLDCTDFRRCPLRIYGLLPENNAKYLIFNHTNQNSR
jgi:hypothetical protein